MRPVVLLGPPVTGAPDPSQSTRIDGAAKAVAGLKEEGHGPSAPMRQNSFMLVSAAARRRVTSGAPRKTRVVTLAIRLRNTERGERKPYWSSAQFDPNNHRLTNAESTIISCTRDRF